MRRLLARLCLGAAVLAAGSCGGSEPLKPGPAALVAEAPVATQVSLSWTPIPGALSYRVYRGASVDGITLEVAQPRNSRYQDRGLEPGITVWYQVRARLAAGESGLSPAAAVTLKPASVRWLKATAGDGQVHLEWSAVPSAKSYRIYRESLGGTAGSGSFVVEGVPPPTGATDLWDGTAVHYEVAAVNETGENVADGPTASVPGRTSGAVSPSRVPPAPPTRSQPAPWGTPVGQVQSWSGTIEARAGAEQPQEVPFWVPDLNRPIRAVLVLSGLSLSALPRLQILLARANIAVFSLPSYNFGTADAPVYGAPADDPGHEVGVVDLQWPARSARRLQSLLDNAALRFPRHSEVSRLGWIFFGFSEGVVHLAKTAVEPPVQGRVLAAVDFCEINAARWMPSAFILEVPQLFVASGKDDQYSTLDQGLEGYPTVTYDAFARGLATNQGAPLTVYNHLGRGHGEDPDDPFIGLWLADVIGQRLAEGPRPGEPVYPSWQGRVAWVGRYTVGRSDRPPWGSPLSPGVRLLDLSVEPGPSAGPGLFTWLPGGKTAQSWMSAGNQPLR